MKQEKIRIVGQYAARAMLGLFALSLGGLAHGQVAKEIDTSEAAQEMAADTIFRNPTPAERLIKALPAGTLDTSPPKPALALPKIQPGDPGDDGGRADKTLRTPRDTPEEAPENYGYNPFGSGTNQGTVFHYSDLLVDSQVVDDYPFRATGHFAFVAADGKSYRCTASLISRSILVTAGHCVHQGGTVDGRPPSKGWIKSGAFYPARTGNTYPYGRATVNYVVTTSGWYNTGAITQGYDVGLVVLNKPAGKGYQIGAKVGWYGFCRSNCLQAYWSLTQLGYPANYYSGTYMTEGQHIETNRSNTDFFHGSGMQGGSSGGPHIANIGSLSDSSSNKGLWPSRNIVFSVTSWGYTSDIYKIQGSSTLTGPNNTNNFIAMYNLACTRARALHGSTSCTLL